MLRFNQCLSILCLGSISACGGGGGGTIVPTPPPPPPELEIEEFVVAQELLTTHADPVTYASPDTAPTSGTAQFNGYAYGSMTNSTDTITENIIGDIRINVVFGNTSTGFTGIIENFIDEDGNAMSGSLTLSSGTFDRLGDPAADSTIGIAVRGTITDATSQELTIGGRLEGDFLGSSTDAIGGEFLGTVSFEDTEQDLNGGFVAER